MSTTESLTTEKNNLIALRDASDELIEFNRLKTEEGDQEETLNKLINLHNAIVNKYTSPLVVINEALEVLNKTDTEKLIIHNDIINKISNFQPY